MSQQLDELMHITELSEEDKKAAEQSRAEAEQTLASNKQHLRLLQDLQNTPGYRLLLGQLEGETEQAFQTMEREIDPIALHKIVGTYCALKRVTTTVNDKIQELSNLLNSPRE